MLLTFEVVLTIKLQHISIFFDQVRHLDVYLSSVIVKSSSFCLHSQASLPVQQYLSMPFEQTQKQTEIARHLPPPLYVLFVQANAYSEACGG